MLILLLIASASNVFAQSGKFAFGVVGDMPYTQAQEREFSKVTSVMNRADLSFVVHVGDFQASPSLYEHIPIAVSRPCSEDNFKKVRLLFDISRHPFILTPGDNDWTDCHRFTDRDIDPLKVLSKLRTIFYPAGKSLGKESMAVISQARENKFSQFVENLTWTINGVTFATLHIVGSNNNFRNRAEQAARSDANAAWLKRAFATARKNHSPGLVLMAHANPAFESQWSARLLRRHLRSLKSLGIKAPKNPDPKGNGFDTFHQTLLEEMSSYAKPVIYIHGDTHYFQINQPLYDPIENRFITNFTRLETFGFPDSHWVRVLVDPGDPQLFTIKPQYVTPN